MDEVKTLAGLWMQVVARQYINVLQVLCQP
jgi:hypothetical protein